MAEYQDIYDIHRNLTGRKVLRGTRRQADEYILVIHLFVFDEQGRLLCGAGVGITGNMMERVDALVGSHVDVVVVDSAHGHSKNIITAVSTIKEKHPDLPIIALTANAFDSDRQLAYEAGCDEFLPKPISSDVCLKTISKFLGEEVNNQ